MPCIMPDMPYCPVCEFGHIWQQEDSDVTDCNWECTCSDQDYDKYVSNDKKMGNINGSK